MHLKHARDWEELLNTIRNIPRFKDFLRPRKCADIMSNLPKEGPIVVINIHRNRCDALALVAGAEEPLHIPLPNFSYQEAARLASGFCDYLFSFGIRSPCAMQRLGHPLPSGSGSDSGVDLPVILEALWSNVVSPILEALAFSVCLPHFSTMISTHWPHLIQVPDSDAKLPRIWWCPTGSLAFLPIHAAGVYKEGKGIPGQTLSEFAVSSYSPTVNVRHSSNSTENSCDSLAGLLMVSQPKYTRPGEDSICEG